MIIFRHSDENGRYERVCVGARATIRRAATATGRQVTRGEKKRSRRVQYTP